MSSFIVFLATLFAVVFAVVLACSFAISPAFDVAVFLAAFLASFLIDGATSVMSFPVACFAAVIATLRVTCFLVSLVTESVSFFHATLSFLIALIISSLNLRVSSSCLIFLVRRSVFFCE